MTVMLLQNNVCVYSNSNSNNNNNNNNNLSKSGPSTIEDQFRQQLNKNGAAEGEGRPRLNVFSLPHTGGKRQGKAMNYYRLWIYTCNAVLFISVVGFVIVAGRVVLVDPRRTLIPGLTLHEPSLLYAYLALLTQSGLLQLLGCIGAHKLNERLLNMYWLLLLLLLFGDAFIGVVWVFRFEKMYSDLKPILRQRLQAEYGVNEEFTTVWDSIQHDFSCCGVEGPQDFNDINLGRKNDSATGDARHSPFHGPDRNRVIVNRTANFVTEETSTDGAKHPQRPPNFSPPPTPAPSPTDPSLNDPHTTYIRNVPDSCCRVLTEDIPDDNKVETHQEPQTKPTAIRQRLEKKKNRHHDPKPAKRSAPPDPCTPPPCNHPAKRHAPDYHLRFRSSHARHDAPYRNTHHYSPPAPPSPPSHPPHPAHPSPPSPPPTHNPRILDTCAHPNRHPLATLHPLPDTLHFSIGCEVKLKKWLRDSAHVLGVLGYCVIAFLKLCFLGILRYEIREMIQKIKMLHSDQQPPVLLLSPDTPHDHPDPPSPASPRPLCNHTDNPLLLPPPDRLRANSLGNALLLFHPPDTPPLNPLHPHPPHPHPHPHPQHRLYSLLPPDTGNDSDTNSHCALLIDGDDPPPPRPKHPPLSSNGNNNYEAHELQDLLLTHSAQI